MWLKTLFACLVSLVAIAAYLAAGGDLHDVVNCPVGAIPSVSRCINENPTESSSTEDWAKCCATAKFRLCLESNVKDHCGKSAADLVDYGFKSVNLLLRSVGQGSQCEHIEYSPIKCYIQFHETLFIGLGTLCTLLFISVLTFYLRLRFKELPEVVSKAEAIVGECQALLS